MRNQEEGCDPKDFRAYSKREADMHREMVERSLFLGQKGLCESSGEVYVINYSKEVVDVENLETPFRLQLNATCFEVNLKGQIMDPRVKLKGEEI